MSNRRNVLQQIVVGTVAVTGMAGCLRLSDDGQSDSEQDGGEPDQSRAEQTGEESTSQVADTIDVVGEVGTVSDSAITQATLTVQRAPGSGEIDLTDLAIQFVGADGSATLVHVSAADGTAATYGVETITAATEDAVITDDSDRYRLVIPLSDTGVTVADAGTGSSEQLRSGGLEPLQAGESAELAITTASDATRTVFIQVPDTLGDSDTVAL